MIENLGNHSSLGNLTANMFLNACQNADTYSFESFVTSGILMTVVICLGIPANILNILVFTHRTMRSSSIINWYLAGLSTADLVALFAALMMFTFPIFSEWTSNMVVASVTTDSMRVSYPVGLIAQTASVWFTVFVSAHRFIGVYFPFQAHRFCTKTAVKRAIVGVTAFSILYNITRFFELALSECIYSHGYTNYTMKVVQSTPLRSNHYYFTFYYTYAYMLFMLFIPFTLLIVMNLMVVVSVHRSRQRQRHATSDAISRKEAVKERKTTIMLLGIVFVFLFCNSLALVNNIIELRIKNVHNTAVNISNLLVVMNASINIVVYCMFSDKYRLVLVYFLRLPWSHTQGRVSEDTVQLEKLLQSTGG